MRERWEFQHEHMATLRSNGTVRWNAASGIHFWLGRWVSARDDSQRSVSLQHLFNTVEKTVCTKTSGCLKENVIVYWFLWGKCPHCPSMGRLTVKVTSTAAAAAAALQLHLGVHEGCVSHSHCLGAERSPSERQTHDLDAWSRRGSH